MAARKIEDQEHAEAERLEELRDQTNEGAAKAAERATKPEAKRGDETVPGGRYRVNGVLVDASGKPLSN